jgi:hypothetical protein
MPKRKKLAIDESDKESIDSDLPLSQSPPKSSKSKGKQRRSNDTSSDDEAEIALIENTQAGLKTPSNGKGKRKFKGKADVKGKGKERGDGKGRAKEQAKDKGKARQLAIDEDSIEEEEEDENGGGDDEEGLIGGSESEGTLYDMDAEPGLGPWTRRDQQTYQIPPAVTEDQNYVVDMIISWRYHPRYHHPQYRVKWEGYSDVHNEWEPFDSFNGTDAIDDFWKDHEFAGTQQRPPNWNLKWATLKKRLKRKGEPTDIIDDIWSEDRAVRKEARRLRRRQIRMDRVEMRHAYGRRERRQKAEAQEEEDRLQKEAEERRRKKREEQEAAKEKEAEPGKKVISHGLKIRPLGGNRVVAASAPTASKTALTTTSKASATATASTSSSSVSSATTAPKAISASTFRDMPVTATKARADESQMAKARLYLTEPDAKLKAARIKAKQDEESSRIQAAKVSSAAAAAAAAAPIDDDVLAPAAIASTATILKELPSTAATDAEKTSPRASTSTATRGAKAAGSFKKAHLNRRATKPYDPFLSLMQPPKVVNGSQASHTTPATPTIDASVGQASTAPTSSGWDDEPGVSASSTATAPPRPSISTNANGSGQFTRPPAMRPPLPPPRGAIRMGEDPRRARFSALPSPASANALPPSPMSPLGPVANNSPLHPNQSPLVHQQSPREGVNGAMSPRLNHGNGGPSDEQKERARKLLSGQWHMDDDLNNRIRSSYNLISPRSSQEGDRETRHLLDCAIGHVIKGGVIKTIEAKHKESHRNVNAWVFNARIRLSPQEIEALSVPTIRFYEYETAIREIWPAIRGKVIMYTFGALMIKLVEQIFDNKTAHAWTVETGTSILIHPWQKAIIQQLLDSDRLEDFLHLVTKISDNVPDTGFELVESAIDVLNEMEEVPSEYCSLIVDAPDAGQADVNLVTMTESIDNEICNTLHRLQYEWRTDKRMFTLVMARTRLDAREVPTAYSRLRERP